jgi:hypothetical protein
MQSSLEKLRKFFGLEREKGYDNTAIIGGLAQMLDHWEGEARAESIREDVIEASGRESARRIPRRRGDRMAAEARTGCPHKSRMERLN